MSEAFVIEPIATVRSTRGEAEDDRWDEETASIELLAPFDWPEVGIFAQRAKDRPNRLGVTVCRIIDVDGSSIHVAGLDAIDGTPVVDVKPWMSEFGPRGDVSQPSWSIELMMGYW